MPPDQTAVVRDARVPGPAVLDVPLLAAVVELVRDDDALQVLHALVAHLPFDAQPHRRAVRDRQIAPVHAVGQDGLRMQRVEHVDAVDPVVVRVERSTNRAVGRMPAASSTQAERHAGPLADRRPAFLARVPRDLRPRRQLLQIGERERPRRGDPPLDRQPPVGERAALQTAVGVAERAISRSTPGSVVPVAGNDVMSLVAVFPAPATGPAAARDARRT